MDLVVVGSVGLDDLETPFGRRERALGGSAIYFSLTATFFTRVGFVGVVGTDFPDEGIELLRQRNVDLRGLDQVEGKTFRWSGRYGYDLNQRDTLLTELNVFRCLLTVLWGSWTILATSPTESSSISSSLSIRSLIGSASAERAWETGWRAFLVFIRSSG